MKCICLKKQAVLFNLLLNLVGCVSVTAPKDEISNQTIYITRCTILNSKFEEVRKLSAGWFCVPKSDGGWISSDHYALTSYNPDGSIQWQKKGFFHHQLGQLNEDVIFALSSEVKSIGRQLMKFDIVYKLNSNNGDLISAFSIYDALYVSKILDNSDFAKGPRRTGNSSALFGHVKLEKSHLNSIHFHQDTVVINDINRGAIVLDHDLKFIKTIDADVINSDKNQRAVHDFQILQDGSYLFFKNSNVDSDQSNLDTYKIFQIKDTEVIFSFPRQKADYLSVSCCGGVEKVANLYLVGFPVAPEGSVVGLISKNGHWVIKRLLPFRIQDIKRVQFQDYLTLNQLR
jgi:hypothetical protein